MLQSPQKDSFAHWGLINKSQAQADLVRVLEDVAAKLARAGRRDNVPMLPRDAEPIAPSPTPSGGNILAEARTSSIRQTSGDATDLSVRTSALGPAGESMNFSQHGVVGGVVTGVVGTLGPGGLAAVQEAHTSLTSSPPALVGAVPGKVQRLSARQLDSSPQRRPPSEAPVHSSARHCCCMQ